MIVDARSDLLVEVAHYRREAHPFRDGWLCQLRRADATTRRSATGRVA